MSLDLESIQLEKNLEYDIIILILLSKQQMTFTQIRNIAYQNSYRNNKALFNTRRFLEKNQFITSSQKPFDKKKKFWHITELGQQYLKQIPIQKIKSNSKYMCLEVQRYEIHEHSITSYESSFPSYLTKTYASNPDSKVISFSIDKTENIIFELEDRFQSEISYLLQILQGISSITTTTKFKNKPNFTHVSNNILFDTDVMDIYLKISKKLIDGMPYVNIKSPTKQVEYKAFHEITDVRFHCRLENIMKGSAIKIYWKKPKNTIPI